MFRILFVDNQFSLPMVIFILFMNIQYGMLSHESFVVDNKVYMCTVTNNILFVDICSDQ